MGTPLASLAATNTENAGAFVATYASANYEFGSPPTDMLWTETPRCLWVETKTGGLEMKEVTVPAAMIVPLSTTVIRGVPPDTTVSSTASLQSTEESTTMLPTAEVSKGESTITSAPSQSSESAGEGAVQSTQSTSSSDSAGNSLAIPTLYVVLMPLFCSLSFLVGVSS